MRRADSSSISSLFKAQDEVPLRLVHRHHRQPVASPSQWEVVQFAVRLQLGQPDVALELAHQLNVDHEPTRVGRVAGWVIVVMLGIKGSVVWVGLSDNTGNAYNAGTLAVRLIKEREIAVLHLVADHVARLIVAYTVPVLSVIRASFEVTDAKFAGLGLHQPILHRYLSVGLIDWFLSAAMTGWHFIHERIFWNRPFGQGASAGPIFARLRLVGHAHLSEGVVRVEYAPPAP